MSLNENLRYCTPSQKKVIDKILQRRDELKLNELYSKVAIQREEFKISSIEKITSSGDVFWCFEESIKYKDESMGHRQMQYVIRIGKKGSHSIRTRINEVYGWSEERFGTIDDIITS